MTETNGHPEDGHLLAHHDGELPPEDDRRVTGHLDGCGACSRRLAELRAASERLAGALARVDVAPPDTDPGDVQARAGQRSGDAADTGGGDAAGRRGRLFRWSAALKAAAVLLGVATAAAAVVPGSPLRRWVVRTVEPLVSGPGPEVAAPARVSPLPEPETVTVPVERRATVRVRGAGPELVIWLRMTDGPLLSVTGRAARYEIGASSVEVLQPTGPELVVELPRSAATARVSADGRLLFERIDGRVRIPGPADTTSRGFALHPGPDASAPPSR